jgi:Uncharacterized protein conserved in bacteria (DUF2344)
MASDTSLSAIQPPHPLPLSQGERGELAPPRCKFRVRFRKAGDLRLVSHHDLMHVFERMFRRADLPIPVTQGFNPRPRMWFALSLALGVAGLNEVLEFEASHHLAADEVQHLLTWQCPPGLEILSVRAIDVKTSARVRRALCRLPMGTMQEDREGEAPAEPPFAKAHGSAGASPSPTLAERIVTFMQRTECWVERARPQPRRINIRPFIHELHAHTDHLDMALWITPNGAARPDEIIAALGLKELLDNGAVIERTDLEVYDELPPGTEGPPLIRAAIEEISANDKDLPMERPTALMDNPMSFDS